MLIKSVIGDLDIRYNSKIKRFYFRIFFHKIILCFTLELYAFRYVKFFTSYVKISGKNHW
jgi:hypothetical protein